MHVNMIESISIVVINNRVVLRKGGGGVDGQEVLLKEHLYGMILKDQTADNPSKVTESHPSTRILQSWMQQSDKQLVLVADFNWSKMFPKMVK